MSTEEIKTIHGYLNKLYSLLKSGSRTRFCDSVAEKFYAKDITGNTLKHWFTNADTIPNDKDVVKDFFNEAFKWLDTELKIQYAPERNRIEAIDITTQMIKEKLK